MDAVPMSQEEKRRCLARIDQVEEELARIRQAVEDELNTSERQIQEWGLHQGYSRAYADMETGAYTSPAIASNTYPTQPDFNSAPQAQYSNDASRKRRDAFDDQTLNTLEEVPNQFHIGAGGQNLNRLFDSVEQEELERELNLDVISNLEDEETSPFQQLPKAPADGPEPPTVSSQIARPKTSLAGLADRMPAFQKLQDSPLANVRTESRVPGSAPPSKFTLVTGRRL